jgi:GT2 family glycosyltransferase
MLSILLIARNVQSSAVNCVRSLVASVAKLRMESQVEYILIDDASDAGQECAPVFAETRTMTTSPVRILKFKTRQHYTRAMAHGFSIARGESILFVSHDMLVPPAYIRTLLSVAALDPAIGLVRGTSTYVDCFPNHVIKPPVPFKTIEDVNEFAEYVSHANGLYHEPDRLLTGDSMLVLPAALKKIGVFDPRYYGYFGDIDFGLRLQRAGLKMVCAKGAWLLHEGAAYYKNEAAGKDYRLTHEARMQVVGNAYVEFRNKWSPQLPPAYPGTDAIDFDLLRATAPPAGGEYQPPVVPDESIATLV